MKVLITGGAGFIGSNLVGALLEDSRFSLVRVIDNLVTGFEKNIEEFYPNSKFEFIKGDIRNYEDCLMACEGMNRVSHQAALGSVPRSVKDPITTNDVNIGGTLNIFNAAKEQGVDRVIYAASSSTYGDSEGLPKVEDKIGSPLSPYAVTKYVMELYAKVFHDLYNLDLVGFRYFNVYGPKQDPRGAYAAVIPLFFKHALDGTNPIINGDGSYSRDFTYIQNVISANILGLTTDNKEGLNQVYNIACGNRTTLLELWDGIKNVCGSESQAVHGPNRPGDIPHSLADVSKAIRLLNYNPKVHLEEGLSESYKWYKKNNL
jgi:UDP-N-acetylglucosamine 4-epimerase